MTRGFRGGGGFGGRHFSWVYKVDEDHRFRIGRADVERLAPWVNGEAEYFATPGPAGGITITSREHIDEVLKLGPATLELRHARTRAGVHGRFLSMCWPISFSLENDRYTITLPEGARKFQLVPEKEGLVVAYISGAIFEVWKLTQWNEHRSAEALTAEAILEELSQG